ncbi:hypothetical protein ACH5RR_033651 [Cinchona calisaya]|uniref:Uncharacterized protein n=1 Tax=Cinchona calisaya TaxID=153742 RepID=A0ABD2Y9K8_9GENT
MSSGFGVIISPQPVAAEPPIKFSIKRSTIAAPENEGSNINGYPSEASCNRHIQGQGETTEASGPPDKGKDPMKLADLLFKKFIPDWPFYRDDRVCDLKKCLDYVLAMFPSKDITFAEDCSDRKMAALGAMYWLLEGYNYNNILLHWNKECQKVA